MSRLITIILAIAVVVLLFLWVTARNDLQEATTRFRGDLSFYRSEIIRACTYTATTTEAEKRACEEALDGFGDLLKNYKNTLVDTIASSTHATTTSTSTSLIATSTATSTR